MNDERLLINGVEVPRFFYGTAWKEEQTQFLVEQALQAGFRGIDTANQRRHYFEAAVGRAITASTERGLVEREDLFVQTKFTFRGGQDHRLPYDPAAPIGDQVQQSFSSSLEHLNLDRIDSYLLHGPSQAVGLGPDDWAAWQSMEAVYESGRVGMLGVSNFSIEQLQQLCDGARITPGFVQNRCFAVTGWDRPVRKFCRTNEIIYQGFSLLTANGSALACPQVSQIATRHNRTIAQVVFRFAIDVGMIPLTGTSSTDHMREDLDVLGFNLSAQEIDQIDDIANR